MIALKIMFIIFANNTQLSRVALMVLFCAGMWKVFEKCGIAGKQVLIPCYRYYALARCADCEPEGRVLFGMYLLEMMMGITALFINEESGWGLLLALVRVTVILAIDIYVIRIYLSLIEVFGVKKRWIILWIMVPWLPALIWGFMKRYQPLWKVEDIEKEKAAMISGKQAVVMDAGMTVNLEERSVQDFMKKKYLLRDVHMYIQPGHMVLLLGGSGAGKTTLLNAMIGYEKAKADMVLNGSNVYRDYKKMQYEIGFVPQLDLMRGNDSVYNTLMDAAKLRLPVNFSKEDRKKRVQEVMDIFGLTPVKKSLVEKLSGGQRKRLSIAMEFIPNPSLFILDEPDSGLDGVMARELMEQLRMIADQGKIILVITHTPDRVIDLFDDVIVLAKDANRTGRLAYFGEIDKAKEFFEIDRMEQIVLRINRQEEGGEGRADEFIARFAEVRNA